MSTNGDRHQIYDQLAMGTPYKFQTSEKRLAKDKHIYLMVAYAALLEVGDPITENKVVAFDPSGKKVLEYLKNNIVPGDYNGSGTTPLQTFNTLYGKIGAAICFRG